MNENPNEINDIEIPDDSEVSVAGGTGAWRFANGKICRGSEDQGTLATREKIIGALKRVGIHTGIIQGTTVPYAQVEADFLGAGGQMIHVKSSLTDDEGNIKSSVATNGFAWGLTQLKENDVVCWTAAAGEPVKRPNGTLGGRPTYVNVARVSGKVATPIYRPKRDKNAPKQSTLEQWHELEPLIRAHPCYADRPSDGDAGTPQTHLAALTAECLEKGWPTPAQNPSGWLAIVAKAYQGAGTAPAYASISQVSEDEWQQIRQFMASVNDCPPLLKSTAAQNPLLAKQESDE